MAASKYTPETRQGLVERIAMGVAFGDACRDVGVNESTVKSWLKRSRAGEKAYSGFAESYDAARAKADAAPTPMDEDELVLMVSKAARGGSVSAMKLRWEMLNVSYGDEEEDEPETGFEALDDEVAQRRARREAA